MRQGNQRLLLAQVFYILERYGLSLSSLLCQLVKRGYIFFFGLCEADYEEEVCVQIAVVEGTDCMVGACVFAEQNNIRSARFEE